MRRAMKTNWTVFWVVNLLAFGLEALTVAWLCG
jgi:hypothetical protein